MVVKRKKGFLCTSDSRSNEGLGVILNCAYMAI